MMIRKHSPQLQMEPQGRGGTCRKKTLEIVTLNIMCECWCVGCLTLEVIAGSKSQKRLPLRFSSVLDHLF